MKKFTIWTESKENIPTLAAKYFQSFGLVYGHGYWNGAKENSVQIVLIVSDESESVKGSASLIVALSDEIKKINLREAVLITEENVTSSLI